MTCREFKHRMAGLSLAEVTQAKDAAAQGHTETCNSCATWLEKQHSLAHSMHALSARTAGLEAGPSVERALLRAFRQDAPARVGTIAEMVAADSSKPVVVAEARYPKLAPSSTPIAWRLSRFFEIGAYAAVAAALTVGVFFGTHLLRQGPQTAQTPPAQTTAAVARGEGAASAGTKPTGSQAPDRDSSAIAQKSRPAWRTPVAARPQPDAKEHEEATASNMESSAGADSSYMALMLCDPLSCASETQVVRVELPASSASPDAQPLMADVVVGDDGLVRAVRLVN